MNASAQTWLISFQRLTAFIALRNAWYGNKKPTTTLPLLYDYNFPI